MNCSPICFLHRLFWGINSVQDILSVGLSFGLDFLRGLRCCPIYPILTLADVSDIFYFFRFGGGEREEARRVPPWVSKNLCCASQFCTGSGGAVGSISKCPRGSCSKMLVRGHNLRLLDEAGSRAPAAPGTRKRGQSAHAESTQGSFPERWREVGLLLKIEGRGGGIRGGGGGVQGLRGCLQGKGGGPKVPPSNCLLASMRSCYVKPCSAAMMQLNEMHLLACSGKLLVDFADGCGLVHRALSPFFNFSC